MQLLVTLGRTALLVMMVWLPVHYSALAGPPDTLKLEADCATGSAAACGQLGGLYLAGVGVTFDATKGAALISQACDGGIQQSCTHLGALLLSGTGLPADPARSAVLFAASCKAGSGEACHYLGGQYLLGLGVETNPQLARAHNLTACQRKVPAACGHLGGMLETGFGYEVDLKLAVTMRNRACTGGDIHSCYKLGRIFEDGRGHAKDPDRASTLYLQACRGNDATACFRLGELVKQGELAHKLGQDPDGMYARALELSSPGCTGGDVMSCLTVADVLRATGRPTEASKLNAQVLPHLNDTCTRGDFTACVELSSMYLHGHGVEASTSQAATAQARACALGATSSCL